MQTRRRDASTTCAGRSSRKTPTVMTSLWQALDDVAYYVGLDALHVGAGELLMRQPGIVGLHAVTSTNALHFAYQTSGDDETRRYCCCRTRPICPCSRAAVEQRGGVKEITIDDLRPADSKPGAPALEQIFANLNQDPLSAAREVLAYLQQPAAESAPAAELIDAARMLVFLKGDDAHDYKFSSAIMEDYYQVSPDWRDVYLATSVCKLRSSSDPDNALVERTRNALKG